ncbi:MAG: CHASE3 domain-containing protein, partial [Nitrospirota bacterium]|nr:CHASE3 domain-containing protein [Nitrospirota bacterium]
MDIDKPSNRQAVDPDEESSLPPSLWRQRILTRVSFFSPLVHIFQNRSIEHRVLAGFGLVFTGILVISAISYRNMTVLIRNGHQDQRSHEFIQLLAATGEVMDDAESGHRRFLVTGDDGYLASYNTLRARAPEYLEYLRNLTDALSAQRGRVSQLEELIAQQLQKERRAIKLRTETGFESVRAMALAGVAKTELDSARHLQVQMEQDETKALAERVVESTATTRSSIILLTIGALLLFVLLAAVYYLIRHDITERRRVANELQRRGELLEAANKELEAFSYSVSHDLRAPLRHIDGYASLLAKATTASLDEKAKRYLQTISESATRMGQLIDDLLVFSRMGRQEMLHGTVNLNQLIASVLHDLRHDLQDRAISWTIAQLPEVTGDAAMLRQVFENLVGNAIKFTGTRPQALIEIGSQQSGQEEAVLFVRDNGVGFDMRYANKLFGVFQ